MTDDIRYDLMEKLLDSPDSLSDEEIKSVTEDEQLRDLYEMSVRLQNSLCPSPSVSASEEWQKFRQRLGHRRRRPYGWILRIAAVFVGVMLLSGIAAIVIDSARISSGSVPVAEAKRDTVQPEPVTGNIAMNDAPAATPAVACETAIVRQPEAVSATPKPPAEKTSGLKPEPAAANTEIDVEEYLRVHQARIDNDIAMAMAKVYENEYNALCKVEASMSAAADGSQTEMSGSSIDEGIINKVTML